MNNNSVFSDGDVLKKDVKNLSTFCGRFKTGTKTDTVKSLIA
jgi:hypothetical protein